MYDDDYYDCSGSHHHNTGSVIGNMIGLALLAMLVIGLAHLVWAVLCAAYLIVESISLWTYNNITKRKVTTEYFRARLCEIGTWIGCAVVGAMFLAIIVLAIYDYCKGLL